MNPADVDGKVAARKSFDRASQLFATKQGDAVRLKDELKHAAKAIRDAKKVGDWAKERSLEVTADRLTPLLKPANSILQGVVAGDLTIDGTEIGLTTPEGFRSIEVLSGAEMTAVAAALQVALATAGDVKLVIIDELPRLRWARRRSLIGNHLAAVEAGLSDHVLPIDHHEDNWLGSEDEFGDDVTIHRFA